MTIEPRLWRVAKAEYCHITRKVDNMDFPRDEKLKVLRRVLRNAGAAAPYKLMPSEQPSHDTIEKDGRWMLGCLGVENPTSEELRELGFIQ